MSKQIWEIEIHSINPKTDKEHIHHFETEDKIYAIRYITTYKKRGHEILSYKLTKGWRLF